MIKDFIVQNWYYLTLLLIAFLNMILLFCKRSKIVEKDTIYEQLLASLPGMIKKVEQPGLSGQEKRQIVLNSAIDWLSKMTGLNNGECRDKYYSRVSDDIESILSAPQKKGDN